MPLGLAVHPLAALFPMLDDDELADLAADIQANGLQIPIMLDAAGEIVVDGRNRLAACKIAGVEPTFDRLREGEDPAAFIVSANLQRRNLTRGQAAMALAMIYPEPKRGRHSELGDLTGSVSAERLSKARAVLGAGKDLVPLVLSGLKTLDVAFAEAWRRRDEATSEEAPGALSDEEFLAQAEGQIRGYGKLVVSGIVEIGRKLVEVKDRVGQAGLEDFVTDRLKWSRASGYRFIAVFGMLSQSQIETEDLTIDASSLYRIAAPSTPAEVRQCCLPIIIAGAHG